MGTSNLYGGPKKTVLLPPDYNPEDNPLGVSHGGELPTQEEPNVDIPNNMNSGDQLPSELPWKTVRRSMTNAVNHNTAKNVKGLIRNYAKALGGHTNATRQAKTARRTAVSLYSYFSGTPELIRTRFEQVGVLFEDRPTKDILNDICSILAPVPNDLEDSLANRALNETIADVALDENIDLTQLESFNEDLLQKMVGGFMKHYIYDKLIQQSEQGALAKCNDLSKLNKLEKSIKRYIDGIVDGIVTDVVRSDMNQSDFNMAVDSLFDVVYQQMEELK